VTKAIFIKFSYYYVIIRIGYLFGGMYLLSTTVMSTIGKLILSFFIGGLFFYIMSDETKEVKKQQIEIIFSLLVNFIIFMWVGKIVQHLPLLFKDPLAILAYPSNSNSFYIATVLIIVNLIYRFIRHNEDVSCIFQAFLPAFIASLFVYEFTELVIQGYSQNWFSFIWLLIVLLIYVFWGNRKVFANGIIFLLWVSGQLIIAIKQTYTTIFGYMIIPMYFVLLLMITSSIIIYSWKRKV